MADIQSDLGHGRNAGASTKIDATKQEKDLPANHAK